MPPLPSNCPVFGRALGLFHHIGRRLLIPPVSQCEHVASLKMDKLLQLQCRFCFFTRRNGRWMVDCTKYGKHRTIQGDFNTDLYW
uniref:39S ribosomal protein L36, mitochondrial n=1 Tax=Globodera rostochiensis TaxID=31243 RepID=A0A914HRQ4_GLORO